MTLDPARLEALERVVANLAQQLAEAQRTLAALQSESRQGGAVPPTPVTAPTPAAAPLPQPASPPAMRPRATGGSSAAPPATRAGSSLEDMIGRYGALALAVLTIVMGAGALVSWAISHGMLGPWVRVALGALLAIVIAGGGWWLRTRGSRDFGNLLIALALAVVDVVAWGAGPRLGLVHPLVSLGVADAAAIALAALALTENEQLLYAAGLGGALVGPFVMASGVPHYGLLAAYGLVLLAAAIWTIGDRPWKNAVGLVLIGTVVYTLSVNAYHGGVPWIDREIALAFAGALCAIALLWERGPTRPWIAITAVTSMAIVIHRDGIAAAGRLEALLAAPDIQLMALAGTALFFAAVRRIDERERSSVWALGVIVVPALFLFAALTPLGSFAGSVSGSIVLVWGLAYSAAALLEVGYRRGALIMLSGFAGMWAITLLLESAPSAVPPALAAYAVLIATVSKSEKQPVVLLASAASVLVAFWIPAVHLAARTAYTTTPFLTIDSLGAASAVGAAILSVRLGLPPRASLEDADLAREQMGALTAAALAFLWGHLELRRAFSADISTFLLIAYYASCGVLAIQQGRARGEGRLRQIGLALAVLAALYAIVAASDVQQIGLRVGSYLLVGVFLLGVAWWYRGAGAAPGRDGSAA